MRWLLLFLMSVHGLIHFVGPAKAFGWAELAQLTQPISRGMAVLWAVAGVTLLASAVVLALAPRAWWMLGIPGVLLSQAVILSAWADARVGTLANLVILAAAVYGVAAHGPWSFRAAYAADVAGGLARESAGPAGIGETLPVTQEDLARLPAPVADYLRAVGAVGLPRVSHFRVTMEGRIRQGPGDAWMTFRASQHNFLDRPSRFFFMDARRGGLPVDVYHRYVAGRAAMRVRLVSLLPLVEARGPEMDRAETVTFFNDLVLFAPAALVDTPVRWEAVDERSVRGHFTVGSETVSALLLFDEGGLLADFISGDRAAASADGASFTRMPWSTPISEWTVMRGRRVPTWGVGRWHAPEGPYAYFEARITDVEVNP